MTWLKEKWVYILPTVFLLGEFIYQKDWFFIEILFFALIIKTFSEASLPKNLRIYLLVAIWGTLASVVALAIYGNFIMPNEIYIPRWLESLRKDILAVVFGLIIAGAVLQDNKKSQDEPV